MIVRRTWTTQRDAKTFEDGGYVTTTWLGWFLFGVIPLYVKATGVHSLAIVSY